MMTIMSTHRIGYEKRKKALGEKLSSIPHSSQYPVVRTLQKLNIHSGWMVQKFLMKILPMNFFPIIYRHYMHWPSCEWKQYRAKRFSIRFKFYQHFHVWSFVKSCWKVNFKSVTWNQKELIYPSSDLFEIWISWWKWFRVISKKNLEWH